MEREEGSGSATGVLLGHSMGIPPGIGGHTCTHTCRYGFWTQMDMPK